MKTQETERDCIHARHTPNKRAEKKWRAQWKESEAIVAKYKQGSV